MEVRESGRTRPTMSLLGAVDGVILEAMMSVSTSTLEMQMTELPSEIKRWTAKRRTALVLQLLRGETTVAEAARQHDRPQAQ